MPRQSPYLQRRGFNLSFRISVPHDLRTIVGAREITKAIASARKCEAVPVALEYAACIKRMFSELREKMTESDKNSLMGIIARAKHKLEIDELNDQHNDELIEQRRQHLREIEKAKLETENALMRSVLAGSTVAPSSVVSSDKASEDCVVALKVIPEGVQVPSFYQVIDRFLEDYPKVKHAGMFKKHMTALPMLRELIGDIPVRELRQTHINEFFAILQKLPPRWSDECRKRKLSIRELAKIDHPKTIGPKTFDDGYKASIRPFLDDAITNLQDLGFPTTLTLKAIKYKGDREEGEDKQRPFKPSELKQLFEGSDMQSFANDFNRSNFYWLPHIGLFTGARVNEICQLNPQTDILQEPESGIWYFWITEETEGNEKIAKSVKNNESKRKIPIHSKLLELGLLDYVESVKKAGETLLFPTWKPSRGKASGEAEKKFRELIRQTGLRDETPGARIVGMHAFRSTLENKGDNTKGLPWPIEHITGHAIPDKSKVSRGYSGELDLVNKQEIMEAISFDVDFIKPTHLS